jgi:hypothetical protein
MYAPPSPAGVRTASPPSSAASFCSSRVRPESGSGMSLNVDVGVYGTTPTTGSSRPLGPGRAAGAEGRLGGLRFVRNWMGYRADPADFVQPRQAPGPGPWAPGPPGPGRRRRRRGAARRGGRRLGRPCTRLARSGRIEREVIAAAEGAGCSSWPATATVPAWDPGAWDRPAGSSSTRRPARSCWSGPNSRRASRPSAPASSSAAPPVGACQQPR